MISMVIKGDLVAATLAASANGVRLFSLAQVCAGVEVMASATDDQWEATARWFNKDCGAAPYPAGTLLHFSQQKGH
jgi:hypothetical protein